MRINLPSALRVAALSVVVTVLTSNDSPAGLQLAWDPNPEPDVAGYRVHYGTESGVHPVVVDAGNDTTATIGDLQTNTNYFFVVTAYNTGGLESPPSNEVVGSIDSTDPTDAAVVGRYVFYNNSVWDGNDPAANSSDDSAIATDKEALLPGGSASFANYTSYSRGLNGIMIDVAHLGDPTALSAEDFVFQAGNDSLSQKWPSAPEPTGVFVRPGEGLSGSDRVTLVFKDNAVQKQWLRVTVLANATTGLAFNDVFYFGNAIGETGDSPDSAVVNGHDQANVRRNNRTSSNTGPVTEIYDINRDRLVNGFDELQVRLHQTKSSTALQLIQPPVVVTTTSLLRQLIQRPMITTSTSEEEKVLELPEVFVGLERRSPLDLRIHREPTGVLLEIRVPEGNHLEASADMMTWVRVEDMADSGIWPHITQTWVIRADQRRAFYRARANSALSEP